MKKVIKKSERKALLNFLKQIRSESGITQVELAKKLGVHQSFVSKYEAGERRLDILELKKICEVLNIDFFKTIKRLVTSVDSN
ncbi:MAG: helix-turn-helix transcriptional regulator [Bdellovibrionota bacterium]